MASRTGGKRLARFARQKSAAMKQKPLYITLLVTACVLGFAGWIGLRLHTTASASQSDYRTTWSQQGAARYLDAREVWWQGWPPARKDHGTICISCHTVVPYAMIRPTLTVALREAEQPEAEKIMLASVEKRVDHWSEMAPFYSDAAGPGKSAESRSTEAVLNAVILASVDAQDGTLRPITRTALNEAWALQERTGANAGAWKWQNFGLAPWESSESAYQGAALLMLAVENAPKNYAAEPATQEHLASLRAYLQRNYSLQPLVNRLYILWLASKTPDIFIGSEQTSLLAAIKNVENADGGWSLTALDPGNGAKERLKRRLMNLGNPEKSDGYATGLVVLSLEQFGANRRSGMAARGITWLETHQESDGSWRAYSLNERRDPKSDIGLFMTDAATAYAVMALENKS